MKKITKALVLALCLALAVCAFAVVSSAEEEAAVFTVTSNSSNGAAGTFEGELISAMNSGAPAIVRLESDGSFAGQLSITGDSNVTIDLNGHTLNMWSSGRYNMGLLFESHGTQFTFCDMSENGGGTINTNQPVVSLKQPYVNAACGQTDVHTNVVFDNVTVNYSGEGSGYMNCPIEVEDLCVDLDINNCVFNSPNAGFIHIEVNMSQFRHAFNFDVRNTEINVGAYVVRFDQGNSTHMVNYYLVQNKIWNFENCTITTEGREDVYPFVYPNWATASTYWNYLPSHHIFVDDPNNANGNGKGVVAPNEANLPVLNLENCTVSTKAEGLISSPAFNPSVININGGSYRINTDGVANGENFISRGTEVQMFQAITLGTYDDGENVHYPSFNFNPKDVTSTTFGGVYTATCNKNKKTYTIDRNAGIYNVVEATDGDDTVWVLEDRVFAPTGLLVNLSLSDTLAINLAIPTKGTGSVSVMKVTDIEGNTIGSTSSMKFTMDGVEYKVFQIKNINIMSTTEAYTFIIVEKATLFEYTVQISILDYAKAVLAGNYSATEKELARSVIAYALEAEKLATEVDTEAVAELTAALTGLTAPEAVTEFADAKLDEALAGTPLYGAAIDFSGDAPALVLALDEALAEDYTVTLSYIGNRKAVNTKSCTFVAGETQVTLSGIKAFDFGNDMTITIGETDYVFNLAALLNRLMAADAEYTDFANALYNYVNAAKAYQADAPQY